MHDNQSTLDLARWMDVRFAVAPIANCSAPHDPHRLVCVMGDAIGDAAEHETLNRTLSFVPDDDQVGIARGSCCEDHVGRIGTVPW